MSNDFLEKQDNNLQLLNSDNLYSSKSIKAPYPLPAGVGFYNFYNALSNTDNLARYGERTIKTSHSKTKVEVYGADNKAIQLKNKNTDISFDFTGIATGSNKALKKIIVYIFTLLANQHIDENLFNDIYLAFPLQALVDNGSYANERTARKAFNDATTNLLKIQLHALVKEGNLKKLQQVTSVKSVMFTDAVISRGTCYIYLNHHVNWKLFALQTFSLLPRQYFELKSNASDLLLNIHLIARQRGNSLIKDNSFNINFRVIQKWLGLPEENEVESPKSKILTPILNAVNEITKTIKDDIFITPIYNTQGNIREILDTGYLKITLSNTYSKAIIDITKKRASLIEKQIERKEKLKEKAQLKALESKNNS